MTSRDATLGQSISVGDLVQVVAVKRCGCPGVLGHIFQVEALVKHEQGRCTECNAPTYTGGAITAPYGDGYIELRRLKRIPPLSELEGEKTQEKRHEPA